MTSLILYSTLGCHLCEQAKSLTEPYVEKFDLALDEVDIAEDDALIEAYGVRIPVLRDPRTNAELGWPFDSEQLAEWLCLIQVS